MPMQNRDDSPRRGRGRRRKRPPTRFCGGAPPLQEPQQHAPPQQQQIEEKPVEVMESDESGTDPEEFDEVITVSLADLRGNVQCPICLGIVKKTRAVMGCLHRFCRECIDKSMRLGNNECPACRKHCASRRSLRDDLLFDTLVSSVYGDLDKYEQEELVLFEEEKAANEKIQASINECFLRQSEATRARKARASSSRIGGRAGFIYELGESSNAETGGPIHGEDRFPISTFPTPCVVVAADDVAYEEGVRFPYASYPANPDLPVWGGAGCRSQPRRGGFASGRQSSRVEKLVDHLANVEKNDHKDVVFAHLKGDEVIWRKDFEASSSSIGVERFEKGFGAEAQGRAPHISGSVLNLVMQGERLMDAMKNGMNS